MSATRIALVDHAAGIGGAQRSLIELVAHLDRSRFEPVILCAADAAWAGAPELSGVEVVPVFRPSPVLEQRREELAKSVVSSGRALGRGLSPVADLYRAVRRSRARLIHTNTLKTHVLGAPVARLAGLPLVWHVRDILEPGGARTWLIRAAGLGRPRVIAISTAVAAQFAGTRVVPTLIHNGIPLDAFTPGAPDPALLGELGLRPEHQVLCVVGRLTPWKGHGTLLEALAQLVPARPLLRLLVVGEVSFWEPSYLAELQALARSLGVADRVVWTGFREDVAPLLRLCRILVLPSVDEPFGRAIIEAMAVGKPVVATRSGGVPEIVVEGETGLLVPPRDAAALAGALAALLDDPVAAERMGQRGCVRARAQFDTRRVAGSVAAVYEELLASRAPGRLRRGSGG
jgi:glycosyltransferase involved in cell wall biosynthesis